MFRSYYVIIAMLAVASMPQTTMSMSSWQRIRGYATRRPVQQRPVTQQRGYLRGMSSVRTNEPAATSPIASQATGMINSQPQRTWGQWFAGLFGRSAAPVMQKPEMQKLISAPEKPLLLEQSTFAKAYRTLGLEPDASWSDVVNQSQKLLDRYDPKNEMDPVRREQKMAQIREIAHAYNVIEQEEGPRVLRTIDALKKLNKAVDTTSQTLKQERMRQKEESQLAKAYRTLGFEQGAAWWPDVINQGQKLFAQYDPRNETDPVLREQKMAKVREISDAFNVIKQREEPDLLRATDELKRLIELMDQEEFMRKQENLRQKLGIGREEL